MAMQDGYGGLGGGTLVEGFVCPQCNLELESAESLMSHFDEEHSG